MELIFLDENFIASCVIDDYISLIWTERYFKCGDFQLLMGVNKGTLELNKFLTSRLRVGKDCYVRHAGTDVTMIVETSEINSDPDEGATLKIEGRSLEAILERRVIWYTTVLEGGFQNGVLKLLDQNIINPILPERTISNFRFEQVEDDIFEEEMNQQITGENLYEFMVEICESRGFGFTIYLDDDYNFVFRLLHGVDRSYEQTDNPYVIFSPKYDNMLDSDYVESTVGMCTVALVAGESTEETNSDDILEDSESDLTRKREVVANPKYESWNTGLSRRELYVDARDIQSEYYDVDTQDMTQIDPVEYSEQLKSRGLDKLADRKYTKAFTSEIEAVNSFLYGKDFFIGDIVQAENEYGMTNRVRVSELIRSEDDTGHKLYPTFTIIEEDENDEEEVE